MKIALTILPFKKWYDYIGVELEEQNLEEEYFKYVKKHNPAQAKRMKELSCNTKSRPLKM